MRVLNNDQKAANFSLGMFPQQDDATAALLQAIDDQVPGVALVFGWAHFVVVHGYVHDEANPCMGTGRALNGVYIRNPDDASIHLVTCQTWHDDYLSVVPCGDYTGNVVVLRGTLRSAPEAPSGLVIVNK
jgi:hypothetical protein